MLRITGDLVYDVSLFDREEPRYPPNARYPVPPASMKVYVKSGTLPATGVNTAVGYLQLEKSGRTYVFAILTRRPSEGPPVYSGTFTTPLLKAMLAGFHEVAE